MKNIEQSTYFFPKDLTHIHLRVFRKPWTLKTLKGAYVLLCNSSYIILESGILEMNSFNISLFAKCISQYI